MSPVDWQRDFRTRVRPLLVSAVRGCDVEALQRRGWSFEALDQNQGGYRIRGRPDEPSIRWSLVGEGSVQVTARPGQETIVLLASFDADMAELLVGAWWAAVKP